MNLRAPFRTILRQVLVLLLSAVVARSADVPGLIADLSSGDAKTRREAAYELHQLAPEATTAVPALAKALDDSEDQVFFHAVSAIAKIGPGAEAAIPALIERLGPVRKRYGEQTNLRCAFALSRIGAAAVAPLQAAISESDETLCANAIEALAMMAPEVSSPALGDLISLLGDDREKVSQSVVKALAVHSVQAVPLLQRALEHESVPKRRDAIRALGLIGKPASSTGKSIVAAAQQGGGSVLLAPALEALVRVRHDVAETTGLIVESIGNSDETTSLAASDAALLLSQITKNWDTTPFAVALETATEPVALRHAAVLSRIGAAAAPTVPHLIDAAANASTKENAHLFAKALGGIGAPAAPMLVKSAKEIPVSVIDDDSWVVVALGLIGRAALQPLRSGLQSDSASTRAASVAALGLLESEARESTDELFAMLKDPQAEVRGQTLLALPRIGVPSARMLPLLEPLAADQSAQVRAQAFRAMGNIKDNRERALPMLVEGLADPEPTVQASAVAATGNLGADAEAAVPSLEKMLDAQFIDGQDTLERKVIVTLGKIGPASKSAVPSLAGRIESPDPEIRLLTLSSLAAIGNGAQDALPKIRAALSDPSPKVRVQAVKAFGAIESDATVVTNTMVQALEDDDQSVRDIAVTQLSGIGRDARPAAPKLFEMLATANEPRPIIDALRNIRTREAKLYVSVLTSKSPSVRLFACEALEDSVPEQKLHCPSWKNCRMTNTISCGDGQPKRLSASTDRASRRSATYASENLVAIKPPIGLIFLGGEQPQAPFMATSIESIFMLHCPSFHVEPLSRSER